MNNVISKSQSLFLVAILAIFPSANAINEAVIEEKLKEISNNFELIDANFNTFNERLSKLEQGQGRQEEARKSTFGMFRFDESPLDNHRFNSDFNSGFRFDESSLHGQDDHPENYAGDVFGFDERSLDNHGFNSDFNSGFRFDEKPLYNQGEQIVNELDHVAANKMNKEEFQKIFFDYLNKYKNKDEDQGVKRKLTEQFVKDIENKINDTGLTIDQIIEDGRKIKRKNISQTAIDAINDFLDRR